MTVNHAANAGQHRYADRGPELYETPACAVEALLAVEKLPPRLWDPAAGKGAIVDVLRDRGHEVIGSDLIDYGRPDFFNGRDFLLERKAPDGCECILTNPPYRIAEAFVAHALELAPLVIMLLRLAFLESERRSPLLDRGKLARIHVFKRRLPFMHRDSWTGPRASSAIPFAFFVWERDHTGPIIVDRISWSKTGEGK